MSHVRPLSLGNSTCLPARQTPAPDYFPLAQDGAFSKVESGAVDSDDEGDSRTQGRRRSSTSGASTGGGNKAGSRLCTRNSVLFLGLVLIQAIGVIAMIVLVFITAIRALSPDLTNAGEEVRTNPKLEACSTYLAIFCLAEVFEVYITLEALLQSNILQIGLIIPLQICMTIYSAFLPSQLKEALTKAVLANMSSATVVYPVYARVRIYAWVILGIIALVTVVMGLFVWLLADDFGWAIFRSLGADRRIKKAYTHYQVLLCLLKYDAFFWLAFSIQFLILVTDTPPLERYLTYIAIPVTVVFVVLAAVAVRYEYRVGMGFFLGVQVAGMAYFAYKIYRMFASNSESRYTLTRGTLLVFASASIVLLLATFGVSIVCLRNFGIGLREKIPPYWSRRREPKADERMEI